MEFIAVALIIVVLLKAQSTLYQKNAFKKLEYKCYFSKSTAYEGEEVEFIEEVINRKWLPLPFFKSEITVSKWLDFAYSESTLAEDTRFVPSFFSVKSYEKTRRVWKVTLKKRGVFRVNQVVLVSSDLLGFSSISAPGSKGAEITVYPKPLEIEIKDLNNNFLFGDILTQKNLVSDPFFRKGVKEYTFCEPLSDINWLATAQTGDLMVYDNDFTTDKNATVIFNMQSSVTEGDTVQNKDLIEKGIKLLAKIFKIFLQTGVPFKFFTNASIDNSKNSVETEEFYGNDFYETTLQILAKLKLSRTDYFAPYLQSVKSKISSTDVIIISVFINKEITDFAELLIQDGKRVKFIILSNSTDNDLAKNYNTSFINLDKGGEKI